MRGVFGAIIHESRLDYALRLVCTVCLVALVAFQTLYWVFFIECFAVEVLLDAGTIYEGVSTLTASAFAGPEVSLQASY